MGVARPDGQRDAVSGMPFARLHSASCWRFPTHKYPLTLFEPIPIAV